MPKKKKFQYNSFAFPDRTPYMIAQNIPGGEKGPMYAYEHHMPCLNPNCKSHGRPHPNCRCYGMADGGEVGYYCSEARPHKEGCEYYLADGGAVPSFDAMPDQSTPSFDAMPDQSREPNAGGLDFDSMPDESEKYGTIGQQALTALEGGAEGLLGPAAPWLEKKLGVSEEDIRGRRESNPVIHGAAQATTLVGGMLTGVGEAGLIAKGAGAISEAANLGKIGSGILKGIVEASSFTGSDEMTKAIIGQSDAERPVGAALMHVGAAGLMGGLTGGVFSLGEGMIGKADKFVEENAEKILAKWGSSGKPLEKITNTLISGAELKAGAAGSLIGGLPGSVVAYDAFKKKVEPELQKVAYRVNSYAYDAIIKAMMKNEASGIPNAIHYAKQISKGIKKTNAGLDALFKVGASKIASPVSDDLRKELNDFISGGAVDRQIENTMHEQAGQFAEGGEVSSNSTPFSRIFPEQDMLLNAAKGRISNYLNSIRPISNAPKLAFDKDLPNREKEYSYKQAVDLAIEPAGILDLMNSGKLTPDHMKHFTSMYPEAHTYLSKELTNKITEAQLNNELPPFNKRQAMSLFMGVSLDTSFTPQAMQAIQGTFAAQKQQQQAPPPSSSAKNMSKGTNSYLTDEQARERRMQNQKA